MVVFCELITEQQSIALVFCKGKNVRDQIACISMPLELRNKGYFLFDVIFLRINVIYSFSKKDLVSLRGTSFTGSSKLRCNDVRKPAKSNETLLTTCEVFIKLCVNEYIFFVDEDF
jgi:hypothetical protein